MVWKQYREKEWKKEKGKTTRNETKDGRRIERLKKMKMKERRTGRPTGFLIIQCSPGEGRSRS
jgi:hypothetical protein